MLDDFFGPSDRKTALSRKLVNEMRNAGLDYSETYKVMRGEAEFPFANPSEFEEYMRLAADVQPAATPSLVDCRVNSENESEDQ